MESVLVGHDGWDAWEPDSHLTSKACSKVVLWKCWARKGGGGGTPIYALYRYVPRDRVGFLRFLILKRVSFLHKVLKLYQLKLLYVNVQLNEQQLT